jgi:hypothetical protein
MVSFRKGDIVQVKFTAPEMLDYWLSGKLSYGPDDVGVIVDADIWRATVNVQFPMSGANHPTAIHSSNLKLVGRVSESENKY